MNGYMVDLEIQINLRRNKLHRTNKGSDFLRGSFSNRNNVRTPIQFRKEYRPKHLKIWLFFKNRPIHFTSIAAVFFDQSNKAR